MQKLYYLTSVCVNKTLFITLQAAESVRVMPRSALRKDLTTHPCLQDKFTALRDQLNEFGGFVVGLSRGRHKTQAHTYRNPFDIQRRDLLDQVIFYLFVNNRLI